ncbi:type II secretion system GspH family protein [bacterium]|nr:type II secretion system GspH family protein [bacterium]
MMMKRGILKKKQRERGFTLIELVIASFIGAMVITGAFIILLGFRQQVKIAWAERAMDQYVYLATRYLTEQASYITDYTPRGVTQNYYAVWDLEQGNLTIKEEVDTPTMIYISGSRTGGIIINGQPFDRNFPPTYASGRHGVAMWDRRDTFELLYLGIELQTPPATVDARHRMRESQMLVTIRMRYRHRERSTYGFLFGEDYARTRTYRTSIFLRNFNVESPRHEFTTDEGSGGGGGSASPFLGWSLASGKSAQAYLKDKWDAKHSRIRPASLP